MISKRLAIAAGGCSILSMAAAEAQGAAAGAGGGQPAPGGGVSAKGARRDGSGLPGLHHIGLVVADRDKALAAVEGGFGFGRAHRFDTQFPTARASSGVTGFSLRIGFVWMGNTLLEFLQPVDDRSPHAAWLRERGEGMHHLGFVVRSIDHELNAMAAARGGSRPPLLVDGTASDRVRWAYVEGEPASGAVTELIERSPQSEQIYRATGGQMPA